MKKRFLISRIFVIALGIAFIILGITGKGEFYSMGIAVLAVGVLKSLQYYRIARNSQRLKAYEIRINDERNQFVAYKAFRMAFWVSVYAEWLCALVLTYLNQGGALILNCLVCFQILIYIICYLIYNRKY